MDKFGNEQHIAVDSINIVKKKTTVVTKFFLTKIFESKKDFRRGQNFKELLSTKIC